VERLPDWWVNFADWSGVHTLPPGKPFPTDIGKNPSLQGFLAEGAFGEAEGAFGESVTPNKAITLDSAPSGKQMLPQAASARPD
jgi:hypothetical protein